MYILLAVMQIFSKAGVCSHCGVTEARWIKGRSLFWGSADTTCTCSRVPIEQGFSELWKYGKTVCLPYKAAFMVLSWKIGGIGGEAL